MAQYTPEGTHSFSHEFGWLGGILAFIGGCIGSLTLNEPHILSISNHTDLMDDFIIRSVIGGAIGLGVKVFGDLIVHWIKNRNNKKQP